MFGIGSKQFNAPTEVIYPKGQLELNAMRLADVFSDDSNYRSFIMINFVSFLNMAYWFTCQFFYYCCFILVFRFLLVGTAFLYGYILVCCEAKRSKVNKRILNITGVDVKSSTFSSNSDPCHYEFQTYWFSTSSCIVSI